MPDQNNHSELLADMRQLCAQFRTVLMATSTTEGLPEISYSPYVIVDKVLYVFLSDLSLHTGNLKSNPHASLLFIEDESTSENLHARRRVTYRAEVTLVERGDPDWNNVLSQMEERFGEIIPILKSLTDFHLFAMRTNDAVLVRGFADAHPVACDGFNFKSRC